MCVRAAMLTNADSTSAKPICPTCGPTATELPILHDKLNSLEQRVEGVMVEFRELSVRIEKNFAEYLRLKCKIERLIARDRNNHNNSASG